MLRSPKKERYRTTHLLWGLRDEWRQGIRIPSRLGLRVTRPMCLTSILRSSIGPIVPRLSFIHSSSSRPSLRASFLIVTTIKLRDITIKPRQRDIRRASTCKVLPWTRGIGPRLCISNFVWWFRHSHGFGLRRRLSPRWWLRRTGV
jgi:hypothetical protein